ncbi:MAG: nucleotide sugar dehydrogenase [Gemmatimonadota bacterium]|jgi:UDP-N-acetyl-D-glucosamine dehydrogenase
MSSELVERFEKKDLTFGVIGLGYVGLPLAVEAARSGVRVLGFDVKEDVARGINEGYSHIQDLTDDDIGVQVRAGLLEATTDMARLSECDAISICVPTPLSKTRDPDVSFISAATEAVKEALREGQLIVLESTTYPGTTREVVQPELERSGLRVGNDFFLCFSPERVDPGNTVWVTRNTPKVIGGITPVCGKAGVALYSRFFDTLVPVSSTEAAELTKILENTFRAVNIGLVNEVALIADRLGVDVWEVIDAAATKPFGFMKFTPGPGLGGHCIPVDPHYLSWKMRTMNYKTRFIDVASEINSAMPEFVTGKVREALNRAGKAVKGSRVLVVGVAYKPNIDDVRESPALDIIRLLEEDGAHVLYHDPFVPRLEEDGAVWVGEELTDELLASLDAAVIVTDHKKVDHKRVLELAPIVVDSRNATRGLIGPSGPKSAGGWIVKGPGV